MTITNIIKAIIDELTEELGRASSSGMIDFGRIRRLAELGQDFSCIDITSVNDIGATGLPPGARMAANYGIARPVPYAPGGNEQITQLMEEALPIFREQLAQKKAQPRLSILELSSAYHHLASLPEADRCLKLIGAILSQEEENIKKEEIRENLSTNTPGGCEAGSRGQEELPTNNNGGN